EEFSHFQSFMGIFIHNDGFKLKALRHWQAKILENFFNAANSKAAAIYWYVIFRQNVRHGSHVIEMTMGDYKSANFILDSVEVGSVSNTVVNARQINPKVIAAVDNDCIIL